MAPLRTPITCRLSRQEIEPSRRCVLSLPGSYHKTAQEHPSHGQMHFLGIPAAGGWMSLLVSCRKLLGAIVGRRYRPELHYMRGPGPKWLERHGRSSTSNKHVPARKEPRAYASG